MSENGKAKTGKNPKVNRMSKDKAKAILAKLEEQGDKASDYHDQVKAVAEG